MAYGYQYFRGTCNLKLQGRKVNHTRKHGMDVGKTYQTKALE
jgi:hypothetical protein